MGYYMALAGLTSNHSRGVNRYTQCLSMVEGVCLLSTTQLADRLTRVIPTGNAHLIEEPRRFMQHRAALVAFAAPHDEETSKRGFTRPLAISCRLPGYRLAAIIVWLRLPVAL